MHSSPHVAPDVPQPDYPWADTVGPREQPSPANWSNLLLGRLLLRACPCGAKVESCPGCQLGSLCRCAHGHLGAATLLESRFWLIAALLVGLALFCVLRR